MENEVRVRYAPSPTGMQHIGGVRTALFNYLFARSKCGKFVLRLEDTDRTRYDEKFVKNLYDTMAWLGIDWDEGGDKGGPYGPYVQSERFDLYKKYAEELVANYTHVAVEFAFSRQAQGGNVYGIFEDVLTNYPYPVPIKLTAEPEDGDAYTIVTFSHPGGVVTIPYAVPRGTELVLSVVSSAGEREHKRITVR